MTDIGIRDISVSFHDNKISNISLVQGDALTRGFDITFVNAKGETLPVDDDYVVELIAVNSKDKDTPYACRHEIVDDKYRVMIPPEALSESGSVTIQLVFYQKSTKAVIHTIKQKCPVYQSIGQEFVESNNLYVDITALRLGLEKIEKLDGKYEEIIEKDIEIQANEIDRKEAEKKRNLDEVIRKDNEEIRKSNEEKREQLKTALIELKNRTESDLESINLTVDDIVSSEDDRKQNEIVREEIKVELENLVADIQNKLDNGDFVGEKGDQGIQGEQGPQGPPGEVTQEEFDNLSQEVTAHKEDYATQRQQDQLKVATVEKELNDYKSTMVNLNVNQEVKQKATGYGIVNLPKNTANGQVSAIVKGETIENLLGEQGLTKRNIGRSSATLIKFSLNKLMPLKTYTLYAIVSNFVGTSQAITSINSGFTTVRDSGIESDGVHKIIINTPVDFDNTKQLWVYFLSSDYDEGSRADIEKVMILEGDYTNRNIEYINNTKSTISASRLKSVGKNLWNLDSEWKIKETVDGIVANKINGYVDAITLLPAGASKIPIKRNGYKQNTRYTLQAKTKGTLSLRIYYTDGTDQEISWSSTRFGNKIGITDTSKTVRAIGFYTGSDDIFAYISEGSLQLEEGAVATLYEPYTESTQYLPNVGELRSLPNGVRDEIKVSGGKAELVKRVSDTMEELAEPITSPIEVSGTLLSYPSGTVYVEKVLPVAGIYTDEITIAHTDFPISSLDKISKVDFATGVETQLNVSKAVVATDKLSFTHTDLTSGDIVFFEYFYANESTQGELELEYYDSRHVLKDSVTGKFYKIIPTVANGVLTNGLLEV